MTIACPAPRASAALFDHDDRIAALAGADRPLPVGMVIGPERQGSGFLIDRCRMLTARHVVQSVNPTGSRIQFRLEPWARAGRANSSSGVVVAVGAAAQSPYDFSNDWALVRLDRCLGDRVGFLPIASAAFETSPNPQVMSVGFPIDRGLRALSIDPSCKAYQRTPFGLLHDCATLPGNSGGPLVGWNDGRRRYEALAIHVAATPHEPGQAYASSRANLAVEIAANRTLTATLRNSER